MSPVLAAAVWAAVAALALVAGAWLALSRHPAERTVGLVAAFGAGALLSAVAFELVESAVATGEPVLLALSLAAGAMTYFVGSTLLDRRAGAAGDTSARGRALLLGAALDGVPESFILGLALASGGGISASFFMAVLVSNLPEGMASASELSRDPDMSKGRILSGWFVVVGVCAAAGALGALTASTASGAYVQSFAAGALLTMLVDDLIPEARERGGLAAGPIGVLGFAVAFGLQRLGG